MNGPEHYMEAERLANEALSGAFVGYGRENHIAAAQVHATLALAAATIDAAAHPGQSQIDYLGAWWEAGV